MTSHNTCAGQNKKNQTDGFDIIRALNENYVLF